MRSSFLVTGYRINCRTWNYAQLRSPSTRYPLSLANVQKQPDGGVGGVSRRTLTVNSETTVDATKLTQNDERIQEGPPPLQLPLSPIMDPHFPASRNRFEARKREPSEKPSAFQIKLRKNPYGTNGLVSTTREMLLLTLCAAQALATPIRSCAITGARLPNYFFLDFGLAIHPRTGKPWQIPKLAIDSNAWVTAEVTNTEQSSERVSTVSGKGVRAIETTSLTHASPRAVAGSNIIAQQSAMRFMSNVKHKTYLQMLPHRWKLDPRFKADEVVWRKDMDSFVLDLMRKQLVKSLQYLGSRPAAYISQCEVFEDIQKKHQPGAVLWLGEPGSDHEPQTNEEAPPFYAMVKYRDAGHIPVYHIPLLLGTDYLQQLRNSDKTFGATLVVIKHKRNTLDTLMQLWKMMGYVASDAGSG
ncbi:MAG: hypothetical protein Q9220_006885 [cf. Caloplaca sp. 1 TL-2023]